MLLWEWLVPPLLPDQAPRLPEQVGLASGVAPTLRRPEDPCTESAAPQGHQITDKVRNMATVSLQPSTLNSIVYDLNPVFTLGSCGMLFGVITRCQASTDCCRNVVNASMPFWWGVGHNMRHAIYSGAYLVSFSSVASTFVANHPSADASVDVWHSAEVRCKGVPPSAGRYIPVLPLKSIPRVDWCRERPRHNCLLTVLPGAGILEAVSLAAAAAAGLPEIWIFEGFGAGLMGQGQSGQLGNPEGGGE